MCYYFSKCRRHLAHYFTGIKTVFKSADESPKLLMSRGAQNPSVSYGICFVNKCPRVRYPSISFSTLNSLWSFPKFDHSPRFRQMGWQRLEFPVERFHSKSKPWKTSQLGSTLSGLSKYWSYNCAKNSVCAAFRNENLSIILVNILLVKIVLQKYNNPLNLYLLLYINMLKE
jgi:hypothetical protein